MSKKYSTHHILKKRLGFDPKEAVRQAIASGMLKPPAPPSDRLSETCAACPGSRSITSAEALFYKLRETAPKNPSGSYKVITFGKVIRILHKRLMWKQVQVWFNARGIPGTEESFVMAYRRWKEMREERRKERDRKKKSRRSRR